MSCVNILFKVYYFSLHLKGDLEVNKIYIITPQLHKSHLSVKYPLIISGAI